MTIPRFLAGLLAAWCLGAHAQSGQSAAQITNAPAALARKLVDLSGMAVQVRAVGPQLQTVQPYIGDLTTIAPYSAQLKTIAPYSAELKAIAPYSAQLKISCSMPS